MAASQAEISRRFDICVKYIRDLPKEGHYKPSDGQKLKIYALFKQATVGDNKPEDQPYFFNVLERAKFDAWTEKRGMSATDAMSEYVEVITSIARGFPPEETAVFFKELGM